ncbi:adenylate/guanylate cyclase domain-containing protein [Gordonia caeni]|uniref:Adenylate/guanylate cyclase domain-containing protein n=1 Tax=Gordonia caeni TaxID=1007097 RepID=A0ABP7NN89_9ACTN
MSDDDPPTAGPSIDYTRDQIVQRLRVDPEFATRLWSAFGFAHDPDTHEPDRDTAADPGEPDFAFTERDVAALAVFVGKDREMDPAAQLAAARSIGQATARLAEWEAEQIRTLAADPRVEMSTEQLTDAVAQIHNFIWRRHLQGFLERGSVADTGSGEHGDVIIGFADIVGYTSLSRRLQLGELETLLEAFESAAHRIITSGSGQVIKSIGDAVMFTAPTPSAAAEIALELHALTSDGQLPTLRIGMAAGPALIRMGDVFGEPVNIAARLASAARAGTTLVDQTLADALAEDPAIHLNHLSSLSVRGYRRLKAHALTRGRQAVGDPDGTGPAPESEEKRHRKREKKARRKGAKEFTKKLESDESR